MGAKGGTEQFFNLFWRLLEMLTFDTCTTTPALTSISTPGQPSAAEVAAARQAWIEAQEDVNRARAKKR